jgi:hypothetical protein
VASENGLVFVIDGGDYDAPDLDTFDMAERRVMFELSGIVEEDFVRQEDETDDEHTLRVRKMTRHPGFMEALMHVAYQRGNPDEKRARVKAVIDKTNFHEAIAKWGEVEEEGDDGPPASESTSEPGRASLTEIVGSNTSSGEGSAESSAQPDKTPASTGITESDISRTSRGTLSAV